MSTKASLKRFYNQLESSLPASTGEQRKLWAIKIIEENISLRDISSLLSGDKKVASRFMWLLSDVAILNPEKLFSALPFLFDLVQKQNNAYLTSFASYWHYVGVPEENEASAIDYLFKWFLSPETNVTTKTRSLWVLVELSKKYPELKQELRLCIGDQKEKYSKDFKKRAEKILEQLEA